MTTYNVRLFGYRGLKQLPLINAQQYSSDSVVQLSQPYEWSQVIAVTVNGAAVSSAANALTQTRIVRMEIPDGQNIRYEINPTGRTGGAVTAGNASPIMRGVDQFEFAPGWTVSIIDLGTVP